MRRSQSSISHPCDDNLCAVPNTHIVRCCIRKAMDTTRGAEGLMPVPDFATSRAATANDMRSAAPGSGTEVTANGLYPGLGVCWGPTDGGCSTSKAACRRSTLGNARGKQLRLDTHLPRKWSRTSPRVIRLRIPVSLYRDWVSLELLRARASVHNAGETQVNEQH